MVQNEMQKIEEEIELNEEDLQELIMNELEALYEWPENDLEAPRQ